MSGGLTLDDENALRALAARYARALDRRDGAAFLEVFTRDAVLRVFDPGRTDAPYGIVHGHGELRHILDRIARYDATFHTLGQAVYEPAPGGATGEVYCTARHLTRTRHEATEFTMLIRYLDRYGIADDGWLIVDRSVVVDWTSLHVAAAPQGPVVTSRGSHSTEKHRDR